MPGNATLCSSLMARDDGGMSLERVSVEDRLKNTVRRCCHWGSGLGYAAARGLGRVPQRKWAW